MNTMDGKHKTLLSWSTGKDSAWSLHVLRKNPAIEVIGLFTTVNQEFERVSMHGTSLAMLARQAEAARLPLHLLHLPNPCPMDAYETIMREFVQIAVANGITHMAFGDIFLTEIRAYRENQLADTGITPLFPLWGYPTIRLAQDMLVEGLTAYVSCVDLKKLPAHFAGQLWSNALLQKVPPDCDPCGENGEFHTVVVGGPMFHKPIAVEVGKMVQRDGYVYADILPAEGRHPV